MPTKQEIQDELDELKKEVLEKEIVRLREEKEKLEREIEELKKKRDIFNPQHRAYLKEADLSDIDGNNSLVNPYSAYPGGYDIRPYLPYHIDYLY